MRTLRLVLLLAILVVFFGAVFIIFFDQAVFVRRGTIYREEVGEKVVALTFDDGPSPVWTSKILDVLKEADVRATFFMLGEHVEKYPDVARRVVAEGHDIGNHTYDHRVLLTYFNVRKLENEIRRTEGIIQKVTGVTTRYFRPPKAWMTAREKKLIRSMGYEIVLWSLNSKDWVTFDDKYMIKYLMHHVRPGDIILFHDSGGAFSTEGGDRDETVLAVMRLIERLKEKGWKFVTVTELLSMTGQNRGNP
ncbi:MAG: polysaccharide deacetylase family protein [Candidatus Omnitrophica bacterium]|nr:polysaccharide deacetylase family protein [Candidatus Omnitrophota bacterium]MDD5573643.1 polysaccharide deacetylase family protein [Candidatus Omnitrophota bacterium]